MGDSFEIRQTMEVLPEGTALEEATSFAYEGRLRDYFNSKAPRPILTCRCRYVTTDLQDLKT